MKRCYQVSRELLRFLEEQGRLGLRRDVSLTWERVHGLGSGRIATLLAAKRGVDPEWSYAAGALHDFGRFVTGRQENHGEEGHLPVQEFLRGLRSFSGTEIEAISLAVRNHSRKEAVGTPLEEIAKDCDILDCHFLGLPAGKEAHRRRLAALGKELGIPL